MSNDYSGANAFNLSLFTGLVVGTSIIVILIYGALYGFNYLGREVTGASRVLVAAYNTPQGNVNARAAAVPVQPGYYTYGQGIYGTTPQTGQYGYGYTQGIAARSTSGQYVCPVHGGVGLPNFDASGYPYCPICGQCMRFNCMAYNSTPQTVGGGTVPNLFAPVQGQVGTGNTSGPATTAVFNRGAG